MTARNNITQGRGKVLGWIGLACLLLIIPVKAIRFVDERTAGTLLVNMAPSLLGPAGLFFLIVSGSGRLSHLTRGRVAVLVTVFALALEFVQVLPRPGILAHVHYTFDWLDVIASVVSVVVSYLIACAVEGRSSARSIP